MGSGKNGGGSADADEKSSGEKKPKRIKGLEEGGEVVGISQAESKKNGKCHEYFIFFFERAVEKINHKREEKIADDVSNDAAAHEFFLGRGEAVDGTNEE